MFQGKYDEFRVWSGAMLPDDVAAHYAAGPNSLNAAPKLTAGQCGNNLVSDPPGQSGATSGLPFFVFFHKSYPRRLTRGQRLVIFI